MSFVTAKCIHCGGVITVDDTKPISKCDFCDSTFHTETVLVHHKKNTVKNADDEIMDDFIDCMEQIIEGNEPEKINEYYNRVLDLVDSGNIDEWSAQLKDLTLSSETHDLAIDTIIKNICTNYKTTPGTAEISGVYLEKYDTKNYPKAARYYDIPASEHIYFIKDSTVLDSFKRGFAIGSKGIYYCSNQKLKGFLPWKDFAQSNVVITRGILYINNLEFYPGLGKHILELLEELQKAMRYLYS